MQGRATQEDGMMRTQVFVGIDVSKAQLDVAFRPEGRVSVPNDEAGCAQVLERLRAVPPTLVVLEATGGVGGPPPGGVGPAGGAGRVGKSPPGGGLSQATRALPQNRNVGGPKAAPL